VQIDQVVLITTLVGSLAGAVSFLFRQLVITKNRRINELLDERDYWRGVVLRDKGVPSYEEWYEQQHRPPPGGRETYVRQQPPAK
jgi:hypothetical protein